MTSDGSRKKTDPKWDDAILALLSEHNVGRAADKVGVSERTLYRWLADDDFSATYRQARQRVFDQAVGRLQAVSGKAVAALEAILDDVSAPHHAKTSAALGVLKLAREGIELDDLVERVKRLEKTLEAKS